MARFEPSRERKSRDSRNSSPRRDSRSKRSFKDGPSFEDRPKRRSYSGRDSSRNSRNRRDFEMTKVTCSSCGAECEVPFKPTSSKPVYCDDCFSKKEKGSSNRRSNKDFDIINEKLDKIMKALDVK